MLWAGRAVHLVMAAFPDEPNQPASWPIASTLLPHGLSAIRHAEQHHDDALIDKADLLNAMAIYLMGRSDIKNARPLFERSLALKQRAYGSDHPEFAVTLDNLGLLLTYTGQGAVARELHRQALAAKIAALGRTHPAVAKTLNNLAAAELATGDFTAACRALEQAAANR